MRFPPDLAYWLLAIFLILWGLMTLIPGLGVLAPIVALIAIIAGILLLLRRP